MDVWAPFKLLKKETELKNGIKCLSGNNKNCVKAEFSGACFLFDTFSFRTGLSLSHSSIPLSLHFEKHIF